MSDNLQIKKPQDPTKINLNEKWEIEYWTKTLGVTPQQLTAAVKTAGVQVTAVKKHLGKQ